MVAPCCIRMPTLLSPVSPLRPFRAMAPMPEVVSVALLRRMPVELPPMGVGY